MSEFSLPPNTTKANFLSLLLSDFFFFFCSFIISHPLYFSYFIFFSPYIIKILSFLSPLFITTSLLLLSLFTTFLRSNNNNAGDANYGQPQLLVFEDLEAYYKIVFDTSSSFENIQEDEVSEEKEEAEGLISTSEAPVDKHMCHESNQLILEGDKEVKPLRVDELKKVEETSNKAMEKVRVDSPQRFGAGEDDDDVDEHLWSNEKDVGLCKTQSFGSSLGSYGSMRKEKEWRRTLACKLFEERHNNNNVEGSDEGMDMLWETYEADSNKKQQQKLQKQQKQQQQQLAKSKTKKGNKWSKYKHHDDDDGDDGDEEEEEIDDDDDDDDDGKLCCLQALKFSAGKMNLGMGRPNLVKISKAFKGIGWLHSMTKHGKKIYH